MGLSIPSTDLLAVITFEVAVATFSNTNKVVMETFRVALGDGSISRDIILDTM